MGISFSYHEALLALTTIVAWADDQNHDSEVDSRVQMILTEGIPEGTIGDFKEKYDSLGGLDETFDVAINCLESEPKEAQLRAMAWMWQVANVSTLEEDEKVDYSHLEEVKEWIPNSKYVDLEELTWINKAKKKLQLTPEEITTAFQQLPGAKRIYG